MAVDFRTLTALPATGPAGRLWYYATADALAGVVAADYFLALGTSYFVLGDVIIVAASGGTEVALVTISASSGGHVSVTQAAGAPLASPAFTGVPTAPTAAPGTNSTQIATMAALAAAVLGAGSVSSVFGRAGNVVAAAADYADTQISAPTTSTNLGALAATVRAWLAAIDAALGLRALSSDSRFTDTRAPTTGAAFNMTDAELRAPKLRDYSETIGTPSFASGVLTVDYSAGNTQLHTLAANVTSLVITNPPATGLAGFLSLLLVQDASGGRTFTASILDYGDASAPTLAAGAGQETELLLRTRDAGASWRASLGWRKA